MRKKDIRKLINIYLDGLVSAGNDAGWSGQNLLAKIIEFGGDVPRGTRSDTSNAAMIQALRDFRPKHHDFTKIERCLWSLLHNKKHRRHVLALLCAHYYHGIDVRTDKVFDEKGKISRWIEHCNRYPWLDEELVQAPCHSQLQMYRYAIYQAAPHLIAKKLN
ncbi:MAG: hypothetical protein CL581_18650 [Alteromonadaceae bacterium]|nr:hypothetical protein [Alteromonadaceae bacterium]